MPNWTHNKVTFYGNKDNIKNILESISGTDENGEQTDFNFNTLIPMPSREELKKCESYNLYYWAVEHWGTKWNACYTSCDEEEGLLEFDTAWCAPKPIILALEDLCKTYGDVDFIWVYADEDMGQNIGYAYTEGLRATVMEFVPWLPLYYGTTDDAVRFACHVWNEDYEERMRWLNEG